MSETDADFIQGPGVTTENSATVSDYQSGYNDGYRAALEGLRAEVMGMVALGVLVDNRRGVLALIDARLER